MNFASSMREKIGGGYPSPQSRLVINSVISKTIVTLAPLMAHCLPEPIMVPGYPESTDQKVICIFPFPTSKQERWEKFRLRTERTNAKQLSPGDLSMVQITQAGLIIKVHQQRLPPWPYYLMV